ncbi:cupin domain-containing protein [Burkholderia guangdongensis]|uniref:cupin domain-containing protein n=1 Tax=Burkholderia guangdongensis TaxID=1792500 RepID=UPI0015C90228|nr:cupin domain-containing protein [Burkholderia guangdongensis]
MNVTCFADAREYFPPNHFMMRCVRLQGHEAGPAESLWLGVSTIEPGGYTTMDASALEKHYVVLEGEVCIETDGGEVVLNAFDSCRLAPGERRALHNRSDRPAKILLAMPFAQAVPPVAARPISA